MDSLVTQACRQLPTSIFDGPKRSILWALLLLNWLEPQAYSQQPTSDRVESQSINLLVDRCWGCHSPKNPEGGFSLTSVDTLTRRHDSGDPAIVPGKPLESELYRRIIASDPEVRMPSQGTPLSDAERTMIEQWIARGTFSPEDHRTLLEIADDGDASLSGDGPMVAHYQRGIPIPAMAVGPNGKLVVGGIGELIQWNIVDGTLDRRMPLTGRRVGAIDWSKTHGWIAAAHGRPGVRGQVLILDPLDQRPRSVVSRDGDLPLAIAFSPTAPILLIGTLDGRIQVIDVAEERTLMDVAAHADQILAVAWKSDGSEFITGSRDRTSRVYAYPSLELKSAYTGHERAVGGVGLCDVGSLTLDETGTLRLWHPDESDRVLASRSGLAQRTQRIEVDGNRIVWLDGGRIATTVAESFEIEEGKNDDGTPKHKRRYRFVNAQDWIDDSPRQLASIKSVGDGRWIASTDDGRAIVFEAPTMATGSTASSGTIVGRWFLLP